MTAPELCSAFNTVRPSLKRTEADELTYSLHIMIRYELEKRLMDGSLPVCDIPREWNRLYGEYLGLPVSSDREGCLQDMHWASGLIGYFPTYALGNAYAAGLYHAMSRELDVPALVQSGNIPAVTDWLRRNIHRHGRLFPPAELIENACGEAYTPSRYIDYLKTRFFG